MSKNKFRGKRMLNPINIERYAPNGWVYGDLIDCSDEMYILPCDISGEMYIDRPYRFRANDYECRVMLAQVDPQSIGQYIGKEDKKGVEIYEGDIVLAIYKEIRDCNGVKYESEIQTIETVVFNEEKAAFELQIDIDGVKLYRGLVIGEKVNNVELVSLEVIGNIYDNPELWEGGKHGKRKSN